MPEIEADRLPSTMAQRPRLVPPPLLDLVVRVWGEDFAASIGSNAGPLQCLTRP